MMVETISKAKAQLSALIERALQGEEVIIGRAGKPVVVLKPFHPHRRPRKPGRLRGRIRIAADFNELPPDIAEPFGAKE